MSFKKNLPQINTIIQGDVLEVLKQWPDGFIDCIITSPPYYGLRDYGVKGQIGLEKTLQEYLDKMLVVTAELKRVLKPTGTMWWNHGDSYGTGNEIGYEKSLLLQAHRLAIRMVDKQKWILRNTIIWHKPNVMPSSVKDRFTVDYEPIFFLTKSKKYWFETQYEPHQETSIKRAEYGLNQTSDKGAKMNAVNVQNLEKMGERFVNPLGRNKRSVWKISTHPYSEAHFATFPEDLIVTPIKASCPEKGIVLDPFMGSGTTALAARSLGRNYLGIEISGDYIKLAEKRLAQKVLF